MLCFSGLGMMAAETFIEKKLQGIYGINLIHYAVPAAIILVLTLSFIPYYYNVIAEPRPLGVTHGFARTAIEYKEAEAILSFGGKTGNCFVVAEKPFLFAMTGMRPIRTEMALSDHGLVENILRNDTCILYFEDLYCTDFYGLGDRCGIANQSVAACEEVRQGIKSRCKSMKETYGLQQYHEYEYGTFKFTLYNITSIL
jgi:hypothetical protein